MFRRICHLAPILAVSFVLSSAPVHAADRIEQLFQRINQDFKTQNWQDGLAAANELVPLARRRWGPQNQWYGLALSHQAVILNTLGRYQEAVDKYLELIAIRERGGDPAMLLRTMGNATNCYKDLGQYDKANDMARRSLAIAIQTYGPADTKVFPFVFNLGVIAKNQKHFAEAEEFFKRALPLSDADPAADVRMANQSKTLSELGDLYREEGRFDEGETLLLKSRTLLEQSGADVARSPAYSDILDNIAYLYAATGRYGEAIKVYDQTLTINHAIFGEDHPNTAAVSNNMGQAYQAISRYSEAEAIFKKSLAIYEHMFGPESPKVAHALDEIANLYLSVGRFAEATGLWERSAAIREKAYGPDSAELVTSLTGLAISYQKTGRGADAVRVYKRALQIVDTRFGANSLQSREPLDGLGLYFLAEKQFDQADEFLQRALVVNEKYFGTDHPRFAETLDMLAQLDTERGTFEQGRARLDQALKIDEAKLGPNNLAVSTTLLTYAKLAKRQGDWATALSAVRKATANTASWIEQITPAKRGELYDLLIEALWHSDDHASPPRVDEAFAAAQKAHETEAGTALAQMATRFAANNDAVGLAIRERQDLAAEVSGLDKKITDELGKLQAQRNDAMIASLRARLAQARKTLEERTARLAHDFPSYIELATPQPMAVAQVQTLLKPDEALVSISVADKTSYVFVVTREASTWREINSGRDALAERVAHLRKGLFDDASTSPQKFDLQASYELYHLLFGDVEPQFAAKRKLLFVTEGALTSLPPHVFVTQPPDPKVSDKQTYRKAAWLLRDKASTVLPSVSSLRALRLFAKTSHATKPFIGFGDPHLKAPEQDKTRKLQTAVLQPYRNYYRGGVPDMQALRTGLPPLPETADELRAIAKVLGVDDGDLRLGDAATVTSVAASRLDQYKIVDFATHGLVAGEVSGLDEPALVLSLPDRPNDQDNGLLTASRVARLNLDADWTVLSACNTAAGDKPGAEGLSGLARAFFYAGTRALLVSNWPVESDAAVKLTTRTFAELAKDPSIGRAEAFRRSMLALIDDSSTPDADPGDWAPFVLVGDGN